ncbi:MAG: hypothetical protein R3C56_34170 [Pirellulaceae bacterium]
MSTFVQLRDRDILSDSRLAKWGLVADDLFSRNATLKAFWQVVEERHDVYRDCGLRSEME